MKNLRKILFIIGQKNSRQLFVLLFYNIINFFLEFLSIISIPIFVAALLKSEIPQNKFSYFLNLNEENFLFYASLFVLVSFSLKNILLTLNIYYLAAFLQKIRSKLSKSFFSHYFDSIDINRKGILPSVMARNVNISVEGFYSYFEQLNKLVRDITAVITISIIIMFINFKIAFLIILIFLIIISIYYKFLRPNIRKKSRANQNLISKFNKMIMETFEAMKDIKVYQKEKIVSESFNSKVDDFEKNMFFFKVFDKLPRIFLEVLSIISILIFAIIFFSYTDNVITALPTLILIVVSVIRLIPAFSGISMTLFYLRVHTPSVEIVYDQLKEIKNLRENFQFSKNKKIKETYEKNLDKLKNFLIIDNISFSYDEKKPLLKNIFFKIPKNSIVSIVGPSGCGKTTLQSILMGFINPDEGNIYCENKNIRLNYDGWIKKISYVSQKVFLFNDTIEKNICLNFDDGKIDKERLEKAIEIAELKQKIFSLENKFNEEVGSDGSKLSGGERQRIALARAIYKKSQIIFLDEFTSNLDVHTESKIINNIKNNIPDVTVIMITHRPEIMDKSDLILRLNK